MRAEAKAENYLTKLHKNLTKKIEKLEKDHSQKILDLSKIRNTMFAREITIQDMYTKMLKNFRSCDHSQTLVAEYISKGVNASQCVGEFQIWNRIEIFDEKFTK